MIRAIIKSMNWYGLIIAIGILVCVATAYLVARRRGIEGDLIVDLIVICLPLAIIGARTYHVVFAVLGGESWSFAEFFGFRDGKFVGLAGLAIYGGIFGSLLGALIFHFIKTRKSLPEEKRINFWQICDLGFTFIILGQGIGRWANYSNLEDYGGVITNPAWQWEPFGIFVEGQWHYAHFFYESLWCILGFGLLLWLYLGKRKSYDGFVLSCYSIFYGLGRSFLEAARTQDVLMIGGVRVSLLVSILFIVGGVANIVVHCVLAKKAGKKIFIFVDQSKLDTDYYGYEKTKLYKPMPDLEYFWQRGKKKKSSNDDIIVDESGVVIHTGDDGEKPQNAEKSAPAAKPKRPSQTVPENAEESYEDSWDE